MATSTTGHGAPSISGALTADVRQADVMGSHPEVDYTATARRETWAQVPPPVRAAIEESLGAEVAHAHPPVGSGFGGQFAGRLDLADGRAVFVKAASRDTLAFQADCLAREAALLASLPSGMPTARPLAHLSPDGWEVRALEHLEARHPGAPWTHEDLDAVYLACEAVAELTTPVPAGIPATPYAGHGGPPQVARARAALADGSFRLPDAFASDEQLAKVLSERGAELAAYAGRTTELVGNSLSHNDLRPDNILITPTGAVLVDWNWTLQAPAWLDFAGLLPMAHRQGLDVEPWLERPLFAGVDPELIDVFLADIAVYMLGQLDQPPPPGVTEWMAAHRAVFAHDFARWFAHRRPRRVAPW
ncbi:phosphotransferase [Calidifontibacter sp. DB0510]|uniref:Phosphotransferase n=1 Tax=Metallococcus carri TaxID=1656884 RepID=A0A967EFR2_9MICO|nr:phosphotransferase [Metallococcus carri]NHN54213.1 phosphotransferase [Metallococcus carri]NOP36947.1 phosphotransferase [Calidifontibacter sp. DB2511S]